MTDLELAIKSSAEKAVLKLISDGNWIDSYSVGKIKLPAEFMADIWKLVDIDKVKERFAQRVEIELADRLVNSIATEMSTDIKQLLSVSERREAIRALARENIKAICGCDKM